MCGVVGLFVHGAAAPPVSRTELIRLRDAMALRGPDGAGEWIAPDGRVGLGHRRLAIIDLSDAAAQPMASADGAVVISFNGEIYNYRELRAELEQRGARFRTASDTEVLLQLYEREGAAMLPRLRGMFAFALWDGRRRGMLLARDPMGIKPLYYADGGGMFRTASQVKALLEAPVADDVDPAGAVSFFLLGYVAEPFTIRRAIRALPAGHSLWVGAGGVGTPRPFFSARELFRAAQEAAPALGTEERRRRIGSMLADSVAAHLVADVPVGLFLSSGQDSTCLASLASGMAGAPLRTLTLGFLEYKGGPADEVPLAQEVAQSFGADHRTVWVRSEDFRRERDRLMAAMDQPTIDGVNSYFVSQAAARAGLKVALSGLGGDELFGSYPSFAQVPRMAALLRPFAALPTLGRGFRAVSSALISRRMSPKFAGLLEYGASIEGAYLLRRALYMPWELPSVLDPDLVREGWRALEPLVAMRRGIDGVARGHGQVMLLEMDWYMRSQLLRDTDWASMAHSLEIRTPLVDAALLEGMAPMVVSAAPPPKADMVMATPVARLPAVVARPKTGFTVPVREWLLDSVAGAAGERGLRGWAKFVFRQQVGAS